MHHHVNIPAFPGSYALITDSPITSAGAVFVHGFLGDSIETWRDFQVLVHSRKWWSDVDLFFLQYSSFDASISESADRLLAFIQWIRGSLRQLIESYPGSLTPQYFADDSVLTPPATLYQRLYLVGHSQGGLVIRKAVLEAAKVLIGQEQYAHQAGEPVPSSASHALRHDDLLLHAQLRLFSPAIMGVRVAGLLGLALQLGKFAEAAALSLSPSYQEMKSPLFLESVKSGTERMAERHAELQGLRARVLWPERDNVVSDNEYGCDRRWPKRAPNKGHSSVCKPVSSYAEPFLVIENVL